MTCGCGREARCVIMSSHVVLVRNNARAYRCQNATAVTDPLLNWGGGVRG
jgi:hypothetical protein